MERRSNINTSKSSRRSSMKRRNTSQEEYRQSTSSLYKQRHNQNSSNPHSSEYHIKNYKDSLFCCFSTEDNDYYNEPYYGSKSRKMSFDPQQLTNNFEPKEYKRGSPRRRRDPTFDLLCKAREIISIKYGDRCKNPMSLLNPSPELNMLCNFFGVTVRS